VKSLSSLRISAAAIRDTEMDSNANERGPGGEGFSKGGLFFSNSDQGAYHTGISPILHRKGK
jgi:hypothetical protein